MRLTTQNNRIQSIVLKERVFTRSFFCRKLNGFKYDYMASFVGIGYLTHDFIVARAQCLSYKRPFITSSL